MTITKRATKGSALTHNELDGNFTDLEERMGWVDYNNTEAAVALLVAGTEYQLTNDGAGAFTNKTYIPSGHGELWDTTNDQFDFSSLSLGDVVLYRFDFVFTASGVNREADVNLHLGTGGSAYSLPVAHRSFKSSGAKPMGGLGFIYIGDTNTLNNPGIFKAQSDGTGDTMGNNGIAAITLVR